jgi:PhoPQ-activated pathogenicity-related protein
MVSLVFPFSRPSLLAAAVAVVAGAWASPTQAGLVEYVQRPEPVFHWELKEEITRPNSVVYDLHLVSQVWQGIRWEHQLQIYEPKDAAPTATMLLWNTGGQANPGDANLGMMLGRKIQAPVAFLYGIPNQPLFGGKKEDALIAETYVRYLATRDENWPLLFPMVKSVVKAMDALQAFSEKEWHQPVKQFVIAGASKRGWTTWLTAAADPRVSAIAPVVIDTLNMPKQTRHQLEAFGRYSEEIEDYVQRGLVPMPDTPEARRLMQMVDPYSYRDRLTLPKFLINGNNDPYWTVDALNLYWDGLKGEKWVLYVPNAGHNLEQHYENGRKDVARALNGLAAFGRHQITGKPLPGLKWHHDDADGKLRLTIEASPPPLGARLWVAEAATQDFRQAKWKEATAGREGGSIIGEVSPPAQGCLAFFGDLDYEIDGLRYHLCTQIRVVGKPASVAK